MGSVTTSRAANLLLATISLLLTLLGFELVARVAYYLRAGGKGGGEQARYLEHDPRLGWRKRPGAHVTYRRREYVAEVAINSRGLRDTERSYVPEEGAFRILALGDSFVEGYSVPLEDAVTQVLQRALSSAYCRVEVLNGGTAGYSTDQEYLFYVHEGSRYSPQVVLLFFYYNDVLYSARERYSGSPKPLLTQQGTELVLSNGPVPRPRRRSPPGSRDRAPIEGSAALSWVVERLQVGAPRAFNALAVLGLWGPMGGDVVQEQMNVYNRRWHAEIERGWDLTDKILKALDHEVRARGARLAVVYVPNRMEVSDRDWTLTRLRFDLDDKWERRLVVERLEQVAASAGIPILDLTPALRAANHGLLGEPYFRFDGHWNRNGHRVAAEAVETLLGQLRWLPRCAQLAPRG